MRVLHNMVKQQVNKIGKEALIPNERLLVFSKLLGEWETTGNHPLMQGVILHGRTSFEWIEVVAFLLMSTMIIILNIQPLLIRIF